MNYLYVIIPTAVILILVLTWLILYKISPPRSSEYDSTSINQHKSSEDDMYTKGLLGEIFVLLELEKWAKENKINAEVKRCHPKYNEAQEIDLIFNIENHCNLGIEVKFRNADGITYLPIDYISRQHQDGNRQSTKQLFNFVYNSDRLGLYAFVLNYSTGRELIFLPHYVLEKIIKSNIPVIYINSLKMNPHSLNWNKNNELFLDYIKKEYYNQKKYFNNP